MLKLQDRPSGMEVHIMRFYSDPLPFKTWEHPVDKSGRSHFLCGGILRSLIRGISSDYVGQGKKQSGGSRTDYFLCCVDQCNCFWAPGVETELYH